MAVVTSRVFAALAQITADLEAASWPPHPVTGITPTVGVGDNSNPKPGETEVGEFVDVVYRVEDDAAVEWSRVSGREEQFLVDVEIHSNVTGADRPTVWARLEELAEVVQGLYLSWDPVRRKVEFTPPAFPGVARLGGLERVTPQSYRTDEGWAGDCIVAFRIHARLDQEVAQ